jgi:tRNA A-37 threonylcarbamoyl transferase component Bud32
MRKVKKIIRNCKIVLKYHKEIFKIKNEVEKELNNITFKFASFGGADINFFILKDNARYGMLRLAIVNKKDTNLPIVRFNKQKRLNKEYTAYKVGSRYMLTPKVLYYSNDALVCEYINGERVFDILQKDKSKVWSILLSAAEIYKKLHSLNIVHLDATLKNFVMDDRQMKVIDFEYYANKEEFTLEEQKAYDYVRIIEHTLRTIPENNQKHYHQFIKDLDKIIPSEIREVDFNYVKPWIKNIQTYPVYAELRDKIFKKLTFN